MVATANYTTPPQPVVEGEKDENTRTTWGGGMHSYSRVVIFMVIFMYLHVTTSTFSSRTQTYPLQNLKPF